MAEYIIQDTTLSAIADRIREKSESAAIITPESMPQGVTNAYDKGYERGVEDTQPIGTIDIDKNGTHNVGGFAYANVDVPIPDGYIKPTGTRNIAENGEYDVTQYAKVKVEIPVAPAWRELRTDVAVATRSVWNYILPSGAYRPVPELVASNAEAAIGTTTANSYGFTDRESNSVYIMPVNKKASSVTVYNTDGKPHTCHFVGLRDEGGTFSVVFDSGKISTDAYKFTAGSITHIIISMERTDGSNFEWGYNDTQVSVEFTGVADAMDEFWDDFQNYGNRNYYPSTFSGFPSSQFYPRYDIKPVGDAAWMFSYWGSSSAGAVYKEIDMKARLAECGVVLDFSEATTLNYTMYHNHEIIKLPDLDLSSSTNNNNLLYYAPNLVEVGKVTGNVNATWTNSFRHTEALQHITFAPGTIGKSINFQHSTKLTPESIESIIGGLSDSVSGQTCSINATAVSNYQREYGGSTWISLVQSKPNWTITTA